MKKIILILFIFPAFMFGQNIDSLKLALKNAKHDTTRCNILSLLTETAGDEEWPAFNEQLKNLAEKNLAGNSSPKNIYLKHLANAFNNIGYLAQEQGDISKGLEYYQKSLKIREEIGDKRGIAESVNNIGVMHQNQGDILKALEYYHKSLNILEKIGDKSGTASALNSIGVVYQVQGDFPKSQEYYHRSLKIREEIGDKYGIAESLNNIGFIYQNHGNNTKALEYHYKSLKIREEIGNKRGIAESLNNIGFIYLNQGEINNALEFYQKSLKIREGLEDKSGIAFSLDNIAKLQIEKGNTSEALVFATKGMQTAKELGYPENIRNLANTLKTIFQKQNKYKEALEMYVLHVKMRDSITNEETQKAGLKKQMQYTYETQARELKNEQDKKDIIAKEELKQKEKERNYFIVGFGLVIVLALFILRGYRQKQKDNVLINAQKSEVEESKKQIIDSIYYAKRIQKAHLPSEVYIKKSLNRLQKL